MPPLVFDFPAIASRLRKDEFYTPRKEETEEDTKVTGRPACPLCKFFGPVEESSFHNRGEWFCCDCKAWFS